MPTPRRAAPQVRLSPKNRAQDEIELENELAGPVPAIPARVELEAFLDLYGKKARVSLMMLRYFCMPSSYYEDVHDVERYEGGFFSYRLACVNAG